VRAGRADPAPALGERSRNLDPACARIEDVDLSRICLVTGATGTAGRGIAAELGCGGATVYLSARDASRDPERSLAHTAELVRDAGGIGVPIRCDHTVEADVAALADRIRRDRGRLDCLVNNAWGGYEQRDDAVGFFDAPFWEQPMWRWDAMFTAGLRATFLTSKHVAPLMLKRPPDEPGLIVNTLAWAYGAYLGNVLYDTAKAATARMAFGLANELRSHHVAAVALALGHLGVSESPRYGGRAIAALASDPAVLDRNGETLTAGDLAREYGFTDIDGTQPKPFALN
jgi:NAD(P)-dependent dehydrogenase (short-subunit alcohol dehydrogenase family)